MSLFEQILQTNLINFIIVISTLVLIFKKAKLADAIEKLAQDVKNQVEKSSQNAQNAITQYKAVKKSLKDLANEQEEILSCAKGNAQNLKEKIESQTKNQCDEIKNNLEKAFSSQKENFKNVTIDDIYNVCVDIAQDEVKKRLNKDTHKKLIDLSINELDKIEGNLLWALI